MSTAEAAAEFDVNSRTVRRWISAGLITGYRVGPRLVKVDLDEMSAFARPIPAAPVGAQHSDPATSA